MRKKILSILFLICLIGDKTEIQANEIINLVKKIDKNLIQKVTIFDVYEGDKLPDNKKSYALSFILEDKQNTLTDSQIDEVMDKLINVFKQKVGAEVRK